MFVKLFGITSYLYFFYILGLSASSFMINGTNDYVTSLKPYLPYNIDGNDTTIALQYKILINIALLASFAIPHSILARPKVKTYLNLPQTIERSFYVFQSSGLLHLLLHYWQSITIPIWKLSNYNIGAMLIIYLLGYLWLLSSTFAIDHFELFGLRQSLQMGTFLQLYKKVEANEEDTHSEISDADLIATKSTLATKFHYKLVRHPIMSGFFIMFWCVPEMTLGHLIFSSVSSLYILLAVYFLEEPDLVTSIGEDYTNYKKSTPMYCPFMNKCK